MTAKKTASAKKPAAKKAMPKTAVAKTAKPVTKKSRGKRAAKPALSNSSTLFLDKESYKTCIDGMMGQGLDREDAIETLKVGIRQANGRPVPANLLRSSQPAPEQAPAEAELAEA